MRCTYGSTVQKCLSFFEVPSGQKHTTKDLQQTWNMLFTRTSSCQYMVYRAIACDAMSRNTSFVPSTCRHVFVNQIVDHTCKIHQNTGSVEGSGYALWPPAFSDEQAALALPSLFTSVPCSFFAMSISYGKRGTSEAFWNVVLRDRRKTSATFSLVWQTWRFLGVAKTLAGGQNERCFFEGHFTWEARYLLMSLAQSSRPFLRVDRSVFPECSCDGFFPKNCCQIQLFTSCTQHLLHPLHHLHHLHQLHLDHMHHLHTSISTSSTGAQRLHISIKTSTMSFTQEFLHRSC